MKRTLIFVSITILSFALVVGAQGTERLLKSGDAVSVSIFSAPELTVKTIVTDGKIDLPLLGKVQAEGLSPAELKQLVEGRYRQYLNAPNITIAVDSVGK